MSWLTENMEVIANLSAIFTAIVAVFGYGSYRCDQRTKRIRLENYLRDEKAKDRDQGQRSLLHLMANVGMTEAELIQASFRSKHIARKIAKDDENGRAAALLLEWSDR